MNLVCTVIVLPKKGMNTAKYSHDCTCREKQEVSERRWRMVWGYLERNWQRQKPWHGRNEGFLDDLVSVLGQLCPTLSLLWWFLESEVPWSELELPPAPYL